MNDDSLGSSNYGDISASCHSESLLDRSGDDPTVFGFGDVNVPEMSWKKDLGVPTSVDQDRAAGDCVCVLDEGLVDQLAQHDLLLAAGTWQMGSCCHLGKILCERIAKFPH